MEDNIPADRNGRTVICMAEAEKQQDGSRTYGKDCAKSEVDKNRLQLTAKIAKVLFSISSF